MSDLLQVSPYLTCFPSGEASQIVFAVDELEPVTPEVNPPSGAAFGVIGLSREVAWHNDVRALDALHAASRSAVDRRSLEADFGVAVVADLVGRGWLQRPANLCHEYLLTTAQIEVTAHCNWGCRFCPVSVDRKPSATMPMDLYEEIVEKVAVHDTIRYVTFHFYNEPTLDRFFEERLHVLARHGLRLRLFTNASNLTERKIAELRDTGVLHRLVVNLPALDEQAFAKLTQSRTYARTVGNLDAALAAGLPTDIVVNGIGSEGERHVADLRSRYEPLGVNVNATLVSDRAGAVAGEYNQSVRIAGRLTGCAWPVNHAHFSVKGDMFICCNDYYQREVFGNIRQGTLHEIMTSPLAVKIRRRVFGVEDAPDDYICRTCHDQLPEFPRRQFRPLATFPVLAGCARSGGGR
ncbi:radical SAM/SPASM domain-containing protein [Krasilnikovia sp. MM14-A1259]|uniref:radical SAM/SPASM domain-containing protein n=1 Tax=Krasilnikovia sp. MM14-A1259 TaxID=3373539 RepID=UPI00380785A5